MVGSQQHYGRLTRLLWLSVAAAVFTIVLKLVAWWLTDSVGLLSDAAESLVNLAAAVIALVMVRWAAQPPDEEHAYGHEKAEYFSAGAEGGMIFIAAITIAWFAIDRLLHPAPIENAGVGLLVSAVASVINLVVGVVLLRSGRRYRSIVLEADGRHLLTDVWTSAGVIAGVALVAVTGIERLDPIVALVVATNILVTGGRLVIRSANGLLDRALPREAQDSVESVLHRYAGDDVSFHALRTRSAGTRSFVSMHVLVPGRWTVQQGHDLLERIETDLHAAVPTLTVFTHLEPREDDASFQDTRLDRTGLTR
jgi:cation diffusion facilitator family transporter